MESDETYMRMALCEAEAAAAIDEVPVGAVLVCRGRVVARAHNTRESERVATHHAELLAIEEACRVLGGWRLPDSTLYVTLEPCPMCAGAAVNARVCRVVFGARDPKAGAFGSVLNLGAYPLNHRCEVTEGVLGEECCSLLRGYFLAKREAQKQKKRGGSDISGV